MTQNTEQIPARWCAVSRTGVATLCVDKNDARESAVQFDQDWPDAAPHVAVLLAPAGDGFVPVAASVLRTLAEPGLVKRTLGKFSPALAAQLGFTPEEEKAIEALYLAFGESFDFQCAAPAARGGALAKHVKNLIEVSRMPNIEHVADAHNAAVRFLRAAMKENSNG